jgi:hypothetical protein
VDYLRTLCDVGVLSSQCCVFDMHGWCCEWEISGLFLGWAGFYVLMQLLLGRRIQRAIRRVCAYRSSRLSSKTPKPHVG